MRITQGAFSFLSDFTDEQITAQLAYSLDNEWAIAVEYTDDPHPRNSYWEMWGQPMFDLEREDVDDAMREVRACREAHPQHYVKVAAYDNRLGRQTTALSFLVNRPDDEPGFRLDRTETHDRVVRYSLHAYAAEQPVGRRYGAPADSDVAAGNGAAAGNGRATD